MNTTWSYTVLEDCESTFYPARVLPAWQGVQAVLQHAGRGRFQRTWFGERGGLWICYNVPIREELDLDWGQLPLLTGVAVMRALRRYYIEGVRLRWPNDLLVGRAKLGGILVERPSATVASLGIGLNMYNDVLSLRGKTSDPVVRLRDITSGDCPSIDEFRDSLGECIADVYDLFLREGMAGLQSDLSEAWAGERPVVAITDDARHTGWFCGVDERGYPILRDAHGKHKIISGLEINRLVEIGVE